MICGNQTLHWRIQLFFSKQFWAGYFFWKIILNDIIIKVYFQPNNNLFSIKFPTLVNSVFKNAISWLFYIKIKMVSGCFPCIPEWFFKINLWQRLLGECSVANKVVFGDQKPPPKTVIFHFCTWNNLFNEYLN